MAISMSDDSLVSVRCDDGLLRISINRPAKANALDAATVEQLIRVLEEYWTSVDIAVFTGEGKHFCAGFDLSTLDTSTDGDLLLRFVRLELLLQKIYYAPFLTVALAHGRAEGAGADVFCACAIRIADPGATFRMPGWQFGLALGTRRLSDRIGNERAREMLMMSARISADDGLKSGLVNKVAAKTLWEEELDAIRARNGNLTRSAMQNLLGILTDRHASMDIAALVESASAPGLGERMRAFRDSARTKVAAER